MNKLLGFLFFLFVIGFAVYWCFFQEDSIEHRILEGKVHVRPHCEPEEKGKNCFEGKVTFRPQGGNGNSLGTHKSDTIHQEADPHYVLPPNVWITPLCNQICKLGKIEGSPYLKELEAAE